MNYIIITVFLIVMIMILSIIYDINIKKLKEFAKSDEEKLNPITDKYPSNIEICKYILNKLKNNQVKVEEDKNQKTCLYIAATDKIIIADVKNSYTRIQTIAHECLHSVQSRKILMFNFIYSNIYILFFIAVTILGIFNKLPDKMQMLFLSIMIILSYVYYFIRSYLENDAMIKARFLAKEYMEEVKISDKEEIDRIVESYDKLNNIGIKATNFQLLFETVVRIIILSIAFMIRG